MSHQSPSESFADIHTCVWNRPGMVCVKLQSGTRIQALPVNKSPKMVRTEKPASPSSCNMMEYTDRIHKAKTHRLRTTRNYVKLARDTSVGLTWFVCTTDWSGLGCDSFLWLPNCLGTVWPSDRSRGSSMWRQSRRKQGICLLAHCTPWSNRKPALLGCTRFRRWTTGTWPPHLKNRYKHRHAYGQEASPGCILPSARPSTCLVRKEAQASFMTQS